MELTEKIETINQQLIDHFGVDSITGQPIWRVVWSEDQYEKRLMDVTDSGLMLLVPEIREVPKYRQWVEKKYVLERLVLVPEQNIRELPAQKMSYEPMFVFEDKHQRYLPPNFEVSKIVVDTVYAALGKTSLAKYKDPDSDCVDPEIAIAKKKARVDSIYNELFGDESDIGDSLVYGQGISVPHNYRKTKES